MSGKIHAGYFVAGLILIAYAIYGLAAGSIYSIDLTYHSIAEGAIWFIFNVVTSIGIGGFLMFRSFLGIKSNQKFHEERNNYEEIMNKSYYEDTSVSISNMAILFVIAGSVFLLVFWLMT